MSYTFNRADCLKWVANPNVNPKTGRKIDPQSKAGVYKQLEKQCCAMKLKPGVAPSDSETRSVTEATEETKKAPEAPETTETVKKPAKAAKKPAGDRNLPEVKKPASLWPNMSRDEILALAGRVLKEDKEAQAKALELNKEYCSGKERGNNLFKRWQKEANLSKDEELALAAEFLGRFCRCVQSIKLTNQNRVNQINKELKDLGEAKDDKDIAKVQQLKKELNNLSGEAFGSCQKSIYSNRGVKGVSTRGEAKIECDDELAKSENIIKGKC